ncbi:MAG TPA: hypothetical protein VF721_12690 [Pyrinomonadaceae bacterium]|jgi:hypothetical protein
MKKFSVRLLACSLAFLLGSGAVIAWLFYQTNNVGEVAPPAPLVADCAAPKNFPALARQIPEIKKGKSGYFPKNAFAEEWAGADDFRNDWYGEYLRWMGEKSLLDASDGGAEIYRFFWLRSFDRPIFMRVERRGNRIKLFTKELSAPQTVSRNYSRNLDRTEWCEFLKLLRQADYWNLPTSQRVDGVDGAQWLLEGVRENRYHLVDRWTPQTGEFREACIYLLRLSGVEIDKLGEDLY